MSPLEVVSNDCFEHLLRLSLSKLQDWVGVNGFASLEWSFLLTGVAQQTYSRN